MRDQTGSGRNGFCLVGSYFCLIFIVLGTLSKLAVGQLQHKRFWKSEDYDTWKTKAFDLHRLYNLIVLSEFTLCWIPVVKKYLIYTSFPYSKYFCNKSFPGSCHFVVLLTKWNQSWPIDCLKYILLPISLKGFSYHLFFSFHFILGNTWSPSHLITMWFLLFTCFLQFLLCISSSSQLSSKMLVISFPSGGCLTALALCCRLSFCILSWLLPYLLLSLSLFSLWSRLSPSWPMSLMPFAGPRFFLTFQF